MKLEWMGEYRELVSSNIRSMNAYAHYFTYRSSFGTDAFFSLSEIQVIEYILENEELNLPMGQVAARLGISVSNFSRIVKKLTGEGFLEKYYLNGNRKNIIIKVSEFGRKTYNQYANFVYEGLFKRMFALYDSIPKEYWSTLIEISNLGAQLPPSIETPSENVFEKIE